MPSIYPPNKWDILFSVFKKINYFGPYQVNPGPKWLNRISVKCHHIKMRNIQIFQLWLFMLQSNHIDYYFKGRKFCAGKNFCSFAGFLVIHKSLYLQKLTWQAICKCNTNKRCAEYSLYTCFFSFHSMDTHMMKSCRVIRVN